ncbi:MAG: hypothetical protein IKX21_03015 [Deltaproteobacteria bacterium]|nr:hypothetical protein [Deltaproteobacteria bacterium]
MKPQMFILFNHSLTEAQRDDAKKNLGVAAFVSPPPELSAAWSQLPPEAPALAPTLAPIFQWLERETHAGDYLLVQGDFGATFLLAQKALSLGLVPLYATTRREAAEEKIGDTVRTVHHFCHVRFRNYEVLP